jgi:GNAT superfamily N-acetyltransferase
MPAKTALKLALAIHPLSADRWADLEKLFGKRGACGGCWCMWWRLPRSQWLKQKGAANKRALKKIVRTGCAPGLLAYVNGEAVGWCALAPRPDYPRLATSRILKPVDAEPVWSLTCFFVARPYRRRGVTVALLNEAARYAASRGGHLLEGYPVETTEEQPDVFVYTGLASAFHRAGFKEVARRSPHRPIFRRVLQQK